MFLSRITSLSSTDPSAWSPTIMEVYTKLDTVTTPDSSMKKGSEQRDYIFGSLFGILSVARSKILSNADLSDCKVWLNKALDLYGTKKWMRETSVHAITELLDSFPSSITKKLTSEILSPWISNSQQTSETLYLQIKLKLIVLHRQ